MIRVRLGVGRVVTFGLSFCLSVCGAVCVDLCAFIWGKGIHVFAEISFFYVPYLFLSSCVRDSNQVVETIL